ncbi:MAG: DNA-3-methyladenine glycosylase I [Pseudomonadota bacterium]
MRSFDEIFAIAADRKGGAAVVEADLSHPKPAKELRAIPGDRWLSQMTQNIFNAGFNWKVVSSMWPGFAEAFKGFDVGACAMMNDEWFDQLVSDTRIVRHGAKIQAVQQNAVFLQEVASDAGSPGAFFADWPAEDYVGLLETLKKRGTRLGGNTGQYFLRFMGVDGFILSTDVVGRLVAEGVVDKAPSSKKAMAATQEAFNTWRAQSGRSFSEISRVLAQSL